MRLLAEVPERGVDRGVMPDRLRWRSTGNIGDPNKAVGENREPSARWKLELLHATPKKELT